MLKIKAAATMKQLVNLEAICESVGGIGALLDDGRFSMMNKLLRVTAYVSRFIHNLRMKINKQTLVTGDVSLKEMATAETEWIKFEQFLIKKTQIIMRK